jgi:hypothetical protein
METATQNPASAVGVNAPPLPSVAADVSYDVPQSAPSLCPAILIRVSFYRRKPVGA